MAGLNDFFRYLQDGWSALRSAMLEPKVDADELAAIVRRAREARPPPVIWLLGRAQSGKTSIVRAMTGSSRAEIGAGFRACTRTARRYDFPPDAPILQFLDTRGLGEAAYDPTEDLAACKKQSHVIVAVMRALEPPVGVLIETLATIRSNDPACAIVVAQTCLHEAYSTGMGHHKPYPYAHSPLPDAIPSDLRRSLLAQRVALETLPGETAPAFVPIDFTLAGDGYEPTDYGLEALWDAIEITLPKGLRNLLTADPVIQDAFARESELHIRGYAITAASVGALPIVGAAGVPALQAKMLHSIASIYGTDFDVRSATEFLTALGVGIGVGYLARYLGRELIKLIPVLGQTGGAIWGATASGASTYALGRAACVYLAALRGGGKVNEEAIRKAYGEGLRQARELLQQRDKSIPT